MNTTQRTTFQLATSSGKTGAASEFCQRWQDRQHSWRHTSEGGFDSRAFEVAAIDQSDAISFCNQHHYAGKAGGMLANFGLYRGELLVGVACLTNGSFPGVLTAAFPDLAPWKAKVGGESAELGRLVLLDEVPANAESWFLAEAFRRAAALGLRGVVSFSDPEPRFDAQGHMTMPGHIGTIYQASNATYTGRITSRTVWSLPSGVIFNEQDICKIRQQKQGHAYAEQLLVDLGATPRRRRESGLDFWHRARHEAHLTSHRHGGNHRYQFALGDRRQRRAVSFGGSVLAYPKKDSSS